MLPRATPADEALVAEAAAGVTNAFAMLVERHASSVLAVTERAVNDQHLACDLAQEIWIKVYQGLCSFQEQRSFRPWLFTIAMNHRRDHQRKSGRRPQHLPVETLAGELAARPEQSLEQREARAEIDAALARVPEPYRSALHLVDVIGLGYEQAAQSLVCSKGTVKSRVHRGRLAFQEAYRRLSEGHEPRKSSAN